ncbi:MAG: DNA repair protein RecO [Bacteroidetes bacterium]|nr:DNA repair protein RecO [Bacteroidota bacterium]
MLIKTRGIILRTLKYSETSIITTVYTEKKGIQKYIISGVRSKKARIKSGLLQVMSLVDLVAYYREDRDLNRMKEIRSAYVYQSIPFNVPKGAVGQFIIEVIHKSLRETEANPRLFEFLFGVFTFLDTTSKPIANIHLLFLLAFSGFLGFIPGGDYRTQISCFDLKEGVFIGDAPSHIYYLNPEQSILLHLLLNIEFENCHQIKMDRAMRNQLLSSLLDYYKLHLDYFSTINSHLILQEILDA